MIWVGIFYLVAIAIILEEMHRAPVLEWDD